MSLFADDAGEYQLLDYSPTHNQLLIRSMKNKHRDHNIDIIFKPVRRLLIAGSWKGIEIMLVQPADAPREVLDHFDLVSSRDYKIFSIKSTQNETYYINAMAFGVYHNKLDILETSLGRYDWEDLGEKILWYKG